jgi:hypothetical protein
MTNLITQYQAAYRECFHERPPEVTKTRSGFVIHGSVCDSSPLSADELQVRVDAMLHWASERAA